MTPGQYIALARDIGLVLGIGLLLWLVYRGGEDRVKAGDLKGLQNEIQQQSKVLGTWRKESTDAQTKLSQDVAAINAAATTPVQHVWVPQPACPQPAVLPATAGKTGEPPTAGGGVQPGGGAILDGSRRDRIVAAFKQRWETDLAQCRALDAQWPQ